MGTNTEGTQRPDDIVVTDTRCNAIAACIHQIHSCRFHGFLEHLGTAAQLKDVDIKTLVLYCIQTFTLVSWFCLHSIHKCTLYNCIIASQKIFLTLLNGSFYITLHF